jgi:hypothetical protein
MRRLTAGDMKHLERLAQLLGVNEVVFGQGAGEGNGSALVKDTLVMDHGRLMVEVAGEEERAAYVSRAAAMFAVSSIGPPYPSWVHLKLPLMCDSVFLT